MPLTLGSMHGVINPQTNCVASLGVEGANSSLKTPTKPWSFKKPKIYTPWVSKFVLPSPFAASSPLKQAAAPKLFTKCGGDPVCSAGHRDLGQNEAARLQAKGYEPFGNGDAEIYLNRGRTYRWAEGVTLKYDDEYKWILSVNSRIDFTLLRGDSVEKSGFDKLVDVVGESADQDTYRQQFNCHALGAVPEMAFGNGTWDFESSRPSNPGWSGQVFSRFFASGSPAAACSW